MNEFIEENKKKLVIFGVIILLTIVLSVVNLISQKGNSNVNKAREERLIELGKNYYSQILYPVYSKNIERYSETGFKITLFDISNSTSENYGYFYKLFSNKETTCNLKKTYIIIYPVKPYVEESFEYKTELLCDLDVKKVAIYE